MKIKIPTNILFGLSLITTKQKLQTLLNSYFQNDIEVIPTALPKTLDDFFETHNKDQYIFDEQNFRYKFHTKLRAMTNELELYIEKENEIY